MKQTRVIFRVFKDSPKEVIALFPDIPENNNRCMSYQHFGQHGAADYDYCIKITTKATSQDYKELFEELTSIGYNLKVCKRK
jgi:hypothetical protein